MRELTHHIGGEQTVAAKDNPVYIGYSPLDNTPIVQMPLAREQDCKLAIDKALAAWPSWAETSLSQRLRILFAYRQLLESRQTPLAKLITEEHGKTLADAQGSIMRGLELVSFHCGLLTQLQGRFSSQVSSGIDCYTVHEPVGICVGISPFNFPVMVPLWMMVPAIACGNAFILKPSEQTPSAALYITQLWQEAGLPAGIAQCVLGDKETAMTLIQSPEVKAVTAVASTNAARHIYQTSVSHGKRAHTFGGAKNHAVVMPDADINDVAHAIMGAAFGSAGERCMAISAVVLVGDKVAQDFRQTIVPLIKAIRLGNGALPDVDMGPLVSVAHRERVLAAIEKGVAEGAELVIDGRSFIHPDYPKGNFVGPTLFDNVSPDMHIYQEEIFGPVLVLLTVDSLDAAIELVNKHPYGNGTAIFTQDGYVAREYTQRVNVGMVGVNVPIPVPVASHPFGGWKQSSFGDLSMHGEDSIRFYSRLKSVTTRWPKQQKSINTFNMPTNQ